MHPETVRQTHSGSIRLIEIGVAIAGCEKKLRKRHAKKVGNFYFLCLVQVTRIYMAPVEETILGFVLATKRVPRCKEEAVL